MRCERCGKGYPNSELSFVYVGGNEDAIICEGCRLESDMDTEPVSIEQEAE